MVLQRRPARVGQKAFADQPLQLGLGVLHGVRRVFRVLDLAQRGRIFGQDRGREPRDFVGDQGQPRTAFFHAALERGRVGRQRLLQKRAVKCDFDDLGAQLFDRAAVPTCM